LQTGKEARRERETYVVEDVLVDHVVQLGRELDSGRSTTAHDERQQALALSLLSRRERSLLEVVHHATADGLGVCDSLELEAVLESRNAVR